MRSDGAVIFTPERSLIGMAPLEWTAHNVRLGGDEWALGDPAVGATEMICARLLQLTNDLFGSAADLSVLDLACLEGLYGLELAMHGARVVGIEGREENARKIRFAADRLRPAHYEVRVEDVRDLSRESHGTFDLVLCLGILYHLEGEDVVRLARTVADCTRKAAVFRTAVGLTRDARFGEYRGFTYPEPDTLWSSIGNRTSFWPTRSSLLNLLGDCGFTSVMEFAAPPIMELDAPPDTTCIVALKGEKADLRAAPPQAGETYGRQRWPETFEAPIHPVQAPGRGSLAGYWRRKMKRS